MTTNVRELLNSFDQLPDVDQREFATEILRRSLQAELPPIEDSLFVEMAEELFLTFEEQESVV